MYLIKKHCKVFIHFFCMSLASPSSQLVQEGTGQIDRLGILTLGFDLRR